MPLTNASDNAAATSMAVIPPSVPTAADTELADWNTYYELLLSGKLSQYGGEFIVIRDGNVAAHDANPDELRTNIAKHQLVARDRLVVPFVDDRECITSQYGIIQ